MANQDLDRRTFVAGAAAFGVGAAAGLAGCGSSNGTQERQAQSASSGSAGGSASGSSSASSAESAASSGQAAPAEAGTIKTDNSTKGASKVYATSDIDPDALVRVFNALGFSATGKVAVKLSTGEPGGHNYLKPELIEGLVKQLNATIVECNTAYGGQRSSTQNHLKTAKDHGFTDIADVDIMDADGDTSLPVKGGKHLDEDLVGSHFGDYGSFVSLAHFKGHTMGGFGGALKNISIGIASAKGKGIIHSAGEGNGSINWSTPQDDFLESMAEAASAVCDALGDKICFVNVLNNLSVDCDCDSSPSEPTMDDIGIMASFDPVALDRACVDQVYLSDDSGKDALIQRIESRNGTHTLDHAEKLGMGSQEYEIVIV